MDTPSKVDSNLRLSINLLPLEVIRAEATASKYYKLRLASMVIVLAVIFFSSATLALRILQSHSIKSAEGSVSAAENKVSKFKGAESSLLVLKNRLVSIDQITSTPSKQRDLFNLITSLMPPSLVINSITTDRSGIVSLTLISSSGAAADDFLLSLLSEKKDQKISSVEIESLSRGRDGIYRITLKIKGT